MKNIQPIKRSEQLINLSRDHHDALLFIWKIRKGLKNGTPLSLIGEYIKWFWENHLKEHFEQEEQVLLPYLPGDAMSARLVDEHSMVRQLVAGEMGQQAIEELATLLNDHVRFEERQFFPHLEQTVSDQQLTAIGLQLQQHSACTAGWTNEFWK